MGYGEKSTTENQENIDNREPKNIEHKPEPKKERQEHLAEKKRILNKAGFEEIYHTDSVEYILQADEATVERIQNMPDGSFANIPGENDPRYGKLVSLRFVVYKGPEGLFVLKAQNLFTEHGKVLAEVTKKQLEGVGKPGGDFDTSFEAFQRQQEIKEIEEQNMQQRGFAELSSNDLSRQFYSIYSQKMKSGEFKGFYQPADNAKEPSDRRAGEILYKSRDGKKIYRKLFKDGTVTMSLAKEISTSTAESIQNEIETLESKEEKAA